MKAPFFVFGPLIVALALLIAGTSGSPAAHGAFPGLNGKITFYSGRDGDFDVYTMTASGMSVTNLTNTGAAVYEYTPAWSADGSKIAYGRLPENGIYVMNADGTGQTQISSGGDLSPTWSPDGAKIAFTSIRDGSGSEIYVMNANGSGQTRLTFDGASADSPAWSPDGSKIAYMSNRDGNYEVYLMNPDGTSQTNITNNATDDMDPDWSPDGTKIVFSRSSDVYTMNANGTGATPLTIAGGQWPAWSPDGAKIAFTSSRTGDLEIYTMNANGSAQTNITNNAAVDAEPNWQPSATAQSGKIGGTVYESSSGYMRGATVTLQPVGQQTTTSFVDGSFSFAGVPYGSYTLVVKMPSCTPYGCYSSVPVTHTSPTTSVAIYPTAFTPTPTPTSLPVGGLARLSGVVPPDGDRPWPVLLVASGLAAGLLAAGLGVQFVRRRS